MTPFHYAAEGNPEIVQLLIKAGTDNINARNSIGETPLHIAIAYGNKNGRQAQLEIVRLMLKEGRADPNIFGMNAKTPLLSATMISRPDLVSLLLQYGAKPNMISPEDPSPLHHAIANHELEIASAPNKKRAG